MKILKSILYYFVVIVLILYILLMALNPSSMMDLVGFRTFIVLSPSMEPVINEYDLIISKEIAEEDLSEGDIVTFMVYIPELGEKDYVTHYLAEIDDSGIETVYKTRGNYLPEESNDGWVDENGDPYDITFDDIEGQYLFRIPYVGYIQKIINDKVMLGLILFNVGIIYATVYVLKKYRKNRELG